MTKRGASIESKVVGGVFKAVWWIVSLPFWLLTRNAAGKKGANGYGLDRRLFESRWQNIRGLSETMGASNFRMAVFEADKLFDQALKSLNVRGETMGERLKSAEDMMSRTAYDEVWQAHKLRNSLAHEMDVEIMSWDAKKAMQAYEKGLKDLGIL